MVNLEAELNQTNQSNLLFNGQDGYIVLGKKPEFKIAQQLTLEAWINCQYQRRRTGIITNIFHTNTIASGYGLLLDGKSGIFFSLKTLSKEIQYLSSKSDSIQLNHWHHIAGTYDGINMRVYVDGIEKASKRLIDDCIDYDPENDLVIGIYKDDNEAYPFKGEIAEVRIWSQARSQAEIQADMNNSLIGNEIGLVGYWPLKDGLGTTVQDLTNNANHGNIFGNFAGEKTEIPMDSQLLSEDKLDDQNSTQLQSLVANQPDMQDQTLVITEENPILTQIQQPPAQDKTSKYPYKILSIDGGGMRAIIPAMILQEIEIRTQKPISSLFDLIAGTSTGGILGLGLSKPKANIASEASMLDPAYTAEDLASIFTDYGNVIFYEPLYAEILGDLDEIIKPKYASEGVEEVLTKYFGTTKICESLTEVLITSYDIEQRIPVLFTSNIKKENIDSRKLRKICTGFSMKEALMSTSATPTYFAPYRIPTEHNRNGFYTLIDGGVVANNPTGLAIMESIINARTAKQTGEESWSLDNTLVLSLGTGSLTQPYPYYQAKQWGLVSWARPMLNIFVDSGSECVASQMEELLLQTEDKTQQQYYRFQPYLDKSLEPMDNAKYQNIRVLTQVAKQLIADRTAEIDELCNKLVN
ncbi:MAG: patatin-like phospholipase family protein [Aphanizomenon gracile PMC638.10]|nr:patatin-like phospholipase family protein [Aphanizomenon gracile PMC638.10]